jgi:hypothetical protein
VGFSALVLQGGAAVTQGIGSYYAAQGQRTALRSQARIAEINARISEGQARDAMLQGQMQQQAIRERAGQIRGQQRVALGANMIDPTSETAIALQTSSDYLAERDVNMAEANALRQAWGYRMEATGQRNQAMMARATAKGISPLLAGATSLLTGAAQTGMTYTSLKQAGYEFPDWMRRGPRD